METSPSEINVINWESKLPPSKKAKSVPLHFRITPKIGKQISKLAERDDRSVRNWMRRCIMFNIEQEA